MYSVMYASIDEGYHRLMDICSVMCVDINEGYHRRMDMYAHRHVYCHM